MPPDILESRQTARQWTLDALGADGPLAAAVDAVSGEYLAARELEAYAVSQHDYRLAEWAQRRSNQIAAEEVIGFLSRRVVIPKYGFPVDVVELDLSPTGDAEQNNVLLQRDLAQAIGEFAPGAQVIANKKVWTSRGVKMAPRRGQWERRQYWRCDVHGRLRTALPEHEFDVLPCCGDARRGTYIVPRWGFTTNRERPAEPRGRVRRQYATRPYYSDPGHWDEPALLLPKDRPLLKAHAVRPGEIVVLAEGRGGRGFRICPTCGTALEDRPTKTHRTPFGVPCTAGEVPPPVSLGHQFLTDVLRLELEPMPEIGAAISPAVAYGLAYAVQSGASAVLNVPPGDLDALGLYVDRGVGILLYDNVPGGAGLVSQLADPETLTAVLQQALERVSGLCGCSEDSSCYGCLRTYRNQYLHHELQRGPVYRYLRALVEHLPEGRR